MRAGNLDRVLTIERYTTTRDPYGQEITTWETLATMRAQLLQSSNDEFRRDYPTAQESIVIFRMRYLPDLELTDRVSHEGQHFDIKEIKEIGRRKGQDLRCTAQGE